MPGSPFANISLKLAAVLCCILLSGCAGTSIPCKKSKSLQQELRTLEADLSKIQGDLDRGYAVHVQYENVTEPYTEEESYCATQDSEGKCTLTSKRTVTKYREVQNRIEDPVTIDIPSLQTKALYLLDRIESMRRLIQQEYKDCLARNG